VQPEPFATVTALQPKLNRIYAAVLLDRVRSLIIPGAVGADDLEAVAVLRRHATFRASGIFALLPLWPSWQRAPLA